MFESVDFHDFGTTRLIVVINVQWKRRFAVPNHVIFLRRRTNHTSLTTDIILSLHHLIKEATGFLTATVRGLQYLTPTCPAATSHTATPEEVAKVHDG